MRSINVSTSAAVSTYPAQCGWKTVRSPVSSRTDWAIRCAPCINVSHCAGVNPCSGRIRPAYRVRNSVVALSSESTMKGVSPPTSANKRACCSAAASPAACVFSSASATATNAPNRVSSRSFSSARSCAASVGMNPQSPNSVPR